jgi:hypothetical protein
MSAEFRVTVDNSKGENDPKALEKKMNERGADRWHRRRE